MIAHASIPSDNPEKAARVLAEIMGGEATPFFPGGPEAFMAWSSDGATFIELIKRGRHISYGPEQAEYSPGDGAGRRLSEAHLAIGVDRPAAEIVEIAKRAEWPARPSDRGKGTFQLVEVWVDGAFLIEFLDPDQTKIYLERVTLANWKAWNAGTAVA
ncbi:MAG: hypothetical protein ACT4O2_09685 [Beijerinckiaceae bacterium]